MVRGARPSLCHQPAVASPRNLDAGSYGAVRGRLIRSSHGSDAVALEHSFGAWRLGLATEAARANPRALRAHAHESTADSSAEMDRIITAAVRNWARRNNLTAGSVASPGRSKKKKSEQNQPLKMVEAGGIEPPSEDLQTMATTRLVRVLFSSRRRPRTGFLEASRLKFRTAAQSVNHDAPSPLNDASTRRRGRAAARR